MAGVFANITSGAVASGSGAVKTILQIIAPSNHRILLHELRATGQGVSTTGTPIPVRVLRQTTAGTSAGAATVSKGNNADDETLQVTSNKDFSAEPTASDVLTNDYIHPQTGYFWQAPFGRPFVIPGGTRLGVEVNNPGTAVNILVTAVTEE